MSQIFTPPSGGNSSSCGLLSPEILSSRDVSASTCDVPPSLPSGLTLDTSGVSSAFCAFDGAFLSLRYGGGREC